MSRGGGFRGGTSGRATALSITTKDGFPEWSRQEAAIPVAALKLRTTAPGYAQRVGTVSAREEVGLFLVPVSRNEPELRRLLDLYRAWRKKAQIMVSGQPVTLKVDPAERYTLKWGYCKSGMRSSVRSL